MGIIEKLGLPSSMSKEEAFWLPIDVLVKQYNWQENVEPIPQSFVDEWYAWRMQKGCPPHALIYFVDSKVSVQTPIHLINFLALPLKKFYTRVKGEKVLTEYFWQNAKVMSKERVYQYDTMFVPTERSVKYSYFDAEGNAVWERSEVQLLDDRAVSYQNRESRFKQNMQDIVVWLNEDIGLVSSDWSEIYAAMFPYLDLYFGGIWQPLVGAIESYPNLAADMKTELIARLIP